MWQKYCDLCIKNIKKNSVLSSLIPLYVQTGGFGSLLPEKLECNKGDIHVIFTGIWPLWKFHDTVIFVGKVPDDFYFLLLVIK